MKECTICKKEKSSEEFHKDKTKKDGYKNQCKSCRKKYHAIWSKEYSQRPEVKQHRREYTRKLYSDPTKHKIRLENQRKWRKENKDILIRKDKDYLIQKKYNITIDDFENLRELQKNKCAICFGEMILPRDCNIDHNHDTDKVRGLLCNRCNRALGLFRDNAEILKNAIIYLQKTN